MHGHVLSEVAGLLPVQDGAGSRETRGSPSRFLRKGLNLDIATEMDRSCEEERKRLRLRGRSIPAELVIHRLPNAPLSDRGVREPREAAVADKTRI